jgi:hypothetical protein
MSDEVKAPVNDGGVQQQTPIHKIQSGLEQIRNAEAQHREKVMGVPVTKTEPAVQTVPPESTTRKFEYQANKQKAEIELETGITVEPGSPGEMQLRNILGGWGTWREWKDKQDQPIQNELAQAIREQTETLKQTVVPKQEPTAFNPLDYVVEEEKPVVENFIQAFEDLGLDRDKATQIVQGIFGAIGRTRAFQTVTTEQSKQQEKENAFLQQLGRLHSVDPDLPNPYVDPEATAQVLMSDGHFVKYMQDELGIQPDMMNPNIVKQYRKFLKDKATQQTLSNANQGNKAAAEPAFVPKPSKDLDSLKTISSALGGAGGAAVGSQLSPQELAEFEYMLPNQKKVVMSKDFRYWNAWAAKNGQRVVNSNEELRALQNHVL